MEITEATKLTKGAIVRFQPSILRSTRLTVRLEQDADVQTTEAGNTYAIIFGYRVRPAELNVSFGERKVYCIVLSRAEILKEA